jgi:photosystem II stability/assembly factor-like uncharacterized protein
MSFQKFLLTISILLVLILTAFRLNAENINPSLKGKAEYYEQNLIKNHLIDGLYVPNVFLDINGNANLTAGGGADVAHAGVWTGRLLAGIAYKYGATKDESVRQSLGQLVLDGLKRLHRVTGIPGLLARGYWKGHGPTSDDRGEHHPGAPPYQDYRWVGSVSVDNYCGVMFGYSVYYDLAADENQKKQIRNEVDHLMGYVLDHNMTIVDVDGKVTEWGRWEYDPDYLGQRPLDRIMQGQMAVALSALKVAHHITGKEEYQNKYLELVNKYKFSEVKNFPEVKMPLPDVPYSDLCMVIESLYNLMRLEKDEQLSASYRTLIGNIRNLVKEGGNTFFGFAIAASLGENDADENSVKTLKLFPPDKIVHPVMNSVKSEWQGYARGSKSAIPVPMGTRPLDNDFEWKGSPYRLDGWLPGQIVSLSITKEDPMVLYAADAQGYVYRSTDGSKTWENISVGLGGAKVRSVAASNHRLRIVFAATDNGVYRSTDGGSYWRKTVTGIGEAPVKAIYTDSNDDSVLYAVTDDNRIFKSVDLGEEWHSITAGLTERHRGDLVLGVAPVKPTVLYAAMARSVFKFSLDESQPDSQPAGRWHKVSDVLPWDTRLTAFAFDSKNPDVIYAGSKEHGIAISRDGGKIWSRNYSTPVGPEFAVLSLAVDYHQPNTVYAVLGSQDILKSEDGGKSWKSANTDGLEIPRVSALFSYEHTPAIYAGTLGGLYQSTDSGKQWFNANLMPRGGKTATKEIGGGDYLLAYWMGRYYRFIGTED